jgi:hypothetical protein
MPLPPFLLVPANNAATLSSSLWRNAFEK